MSSKYSKQIFILSGQSNMAGRGGIITDHSHHHHHKHWDGVVPPQCEPNPNILRLDAHLNWEVARDPLHHDIDVSKPCGVGPGMPFANWLLKEGGTAGTMSIGLVPCAVGGTAIREWARGEKLYENMVKRAKESVQDGGEIKAVLWYQGESDTLREEDADVYMGKMDKLICDVREDLGLPSLPFIQVALASGDSKYIDKVRAAQLGMNLPNVVCVDAKGLKLNSDNLHLSTEAQVQLGQMLADAYLLHFHPSTLSEKQQPCPDSKGN